MKLLEHILVEINSSAYQEIIMYDLPLILQCQKIRIYDFFNFSKSSDKKNDKGSCNMEIPFKNIELPVFSEVPSEYLKIDDIWDFNKWRERIEHKIIDRESTKQTQGIDKNFEVEHSYVNF